MRFRLISLLLVVSLLALAIPTRFIRIIPTAEAASTTIVISQFQVGGGVATDEFVELHNVSNASYDLNGHRLVYRSSTGTADAGTALAIWTTSTIIPAGGYYLVAASPGYDGTTPADRTYNSGSVSMSGQSTGGGLALRNGAANTGTIIDSLAYGSTTTTTFTEGANTSTPPSNDSRARSGSGCTDTDNNSADFVAQSPAAPRNSGTTPFICGGGGTTAPSITGHPQSQTISSGQTATLTVTAGGSAPLSYQWYQGTAPNTSTPVGSNSSSFTTPPLTNTTSYWVRVSNSAGTADSNTATVTVQSSTNPTGTGSASPASVFPGESTTLTVNVTPGTNPPSTGLSVTANLTAIGGSSTQALSGSGNTFTYTATVGAGTTPGSKTLPITVSDAESRSSGFNITLTVKTPPPPQDHIVISEVYGANGNLYRSDFVELYNPTTQSVTVTGWSVQYASATGSGWSTNSQTLAGSIGPHEYYLVKLATSASGTNELTRWNAEGSINMSGTNGKIALVKNGAALTGSNAVCPLDDPDLVDFVGYGTANCSEGGAAAPSPGNSTSIFRDANGTDTNNNGADFTAGTPDPQSTAPIFDAPPKVTNVDTDDDFGLDAPTPRDGSFNVFFSEPVVAEGAWYDINCTVTNNHTAVVYPGTTRWIVTPDVNFQPGEQCTFQVFAANVKDADENDSEPNTDQLEANYSETFTVASGTAPPETPDVHLAMGNPSDEAADYGTPTNYLMEKPEFALSFNRDRGTPNWVSWHLSVDWTGTLLRIDSFRPDPAIPVEWNRVLNTDYSGSGFDRGHMVPNADRDKETSFPINQATFLMTNMIPQAPDNNQGPWADMENDLRSIAGSTNELYIVAGGAGTGGYNAAPTAANPTPTPVTTIAGGKVTVPAQTWKVVLVIPKAAGDDISRVSCDTRTIAVIMPNKQGIRNDDWHDYIVSVDAVEQLTGYDFFENLPDPVERCVEAGVNGVNPPLDTDNDGVADSTDNCDFDANADQANNDGDAEGDVCDADDDNDGQTDVDEIACGSNPLVAGSKAADNDGDNSPDCVDTDDDNDGVADTNDAFPFDPNESVDTDGDGTGNNADADDDNDGQTDADENACGSNPLNAASKAADNDVDNSPDCVDADDDNDGVADTQDAFPFDASETVDTDGDGTGNNADMDDDGDGQSDAHETTCGSNPLDGASKAADNDGDNTPDCVDADDDNDGVADVDDNCDFTKNPDQADFDGDGIGDACEVIADPPSNMQQCKDGGWQNWTPRFKNQGDCIQYVNTKK